MDFWTKIFYTKSWIGPTQNHVIPNQNVNIVHIFKWTRTMAVELKTKQEVKIIEKNEKKNTP